MQEIIQITQAEARREELRLAQPVDFVLREGEHVAVCGDNGSGKSLFIDLLRGATPVRRGEVRASFDGSSSLADHVRYVAFRDVYGEGTPAYYQQRWNQWDDEACPTVGEALAESLRAAARFAEKSGRLADLSARRADFSGGRADFSGRRADTDACAAVSGETEADALRRLLDLFYTDADAVVCRPVRLLSSGELRKFHVARALVARPRVLILDSPFIGLDADARRVLTDVLGRLARQLTLVLVVSRREDIPPFIDCVVGVENGVVGPKVPLGEYLSRPLPPLPVLDDAGRGRLRQLAARGAETEADVVAELRDVSVVYGGRHILRGLSWTVRRGEAWALQGGNGAGKSTLLSLLCADNPMAYACDIRLFGRRRGRGESIWDIKRHIGYVSPEIYQTYRKRLPVIDIVASGLYDTVGLYRQPDAADRALCRGWLALFGAEALADRDYMTLSSGEQRLALLVRAFVKSPALVVLDEPFHGLDDRRRALARDIIGAYAGLPGKTLVMVSHYEEDFPSCISRRLRLVRGDMPHAADPASKTESTTH